MLLNKLLAVLAFFALVLCSRVPPTMGTASIGMALAVVLMLVLLPLARGVVDDWVS